MAAAPLYRQIYEQLAAAIMSGEIAPGDALPTEEALCAMFSVSRITVRKALDELASRQLVVRRRGVGTFAVDARHSVRSVTLSGFIEEVLSPNRLTLVREESVRLPEAIADFAGARRDLPVRLFEGTNHLLDGSPLAHLRYYFPSEIAALLTGAALAGPLPPIKLIQQLTGTQVDHAEQLVEPMIATGRVARYLRIPRGSAVLRAIRVYYDAARRPLEIFDAAYHPANYRYTATLYPRAGAGAPSQA